MKAKSKLALPEWTKYLPSTAKITAKEISEFFGFKGVSYVHKMTAIGEFPESEPEIPRTVRVASSNKNKFNFPKKYWHLGTLRAYEIKQNQESK